MTPVFSSNTGARHLLKVLSPNPDRSAWCSGTDVSNESFTMVMTSSDSTLLKLFLFGFRKLLVWLMAPGISLLASSGPVDTPSPRAISRRYAAARNTLSGSW